MDYLSMIDDVREEQVDLKEQFIKEQMEKIRSARERGCHSTIWYDYKEKYQAILPEMQKMFESKGYRIKPTGYCGGVWQDSRDICW